MLHFAFRTLTLLFLHQEEHTTCKRFTPPFPEDFRTDILEVCGVTCNKHGTVKHVIKD